MLFLPSRGVNIHKEKLELVKGRNINISNKSAKYNHIKTKKRPTRNWSLLKLEKILSGIFSHSTVGSAYFYYAKNWKLE